MEIESYVAERRKNKKKKSRKLFIATVVFLAILVVVAVLWVFFRSPFLRVKRVVIEGNSAVPSDNIMDLLRREALLDHGFPASLLGLDSMFVWPTALTPGELAMLPQLSSLQIHKNYWNRTITVDVTERQPLAIWCSMPKIDANGNPEGDEACYWFDDTGTLFLRAFDTEGSAISAVHDYSQHGAVLQGKILPDIFIPNLISILTVVRQSGLNVQEIALNDINLQEIDVSTYGGPGLSFSLRFPADEDAPVLASLMANPDFNKLQYVDFRVENRAYYK